MIPDDPSTHEGKCGPYDEICGACFDATLKERNNLRLQNGEAMKIMSHLHSLLSLVRHRYLERGVDSLERDIDQLLGQSEKALTPFWKEQMQQTEKRNHESVRETAERLGMKTDAARRIVHCGGSGCRQKCVCGCADCLAIENF
jgi:hypothetical protein